MKVEKREREIETLSNLVEGTDALFAGVGFEVAHDHLLYEEPWPSGGNCGEGEGC